MLTPILSDSGHVLPLTLFGLATRHSSPFSVLFRVNDTSFVHMLCYHIQ